MPEHIETLRKTRRSGQLARIGSFVRRKPLEASFLLRMGIWVAILSLLIKFLPLPRVIALVSTDFRRRASQTNSWISAERLAQLIDLLLGLDILCFTPTCWKRAPILHRYLALNGIHTRIVFGVRKENDASLAGHAWLEAGGHPFLEDTFPHYAVTYTFPK